MSVHAFKSSRAPLFQILDVAAVLSFALFWGALGAGFAISGSAWQLLTSLALGLFSGYLAADLLSGVVHWFADSFFEESDPVVGSLLIAPFREHHRDPKGITRHGFFELTGNSCLVTIPLLVALWLWGGSEGGLARAGTAFVLCASLGVLITNPIHSWAHSSPANTPRSVRWLQQRGVILSVAHHAHHHSGENDRAYCVTSGWLNPLFDRFDLFGRMAHWIRSWRPSARA